MKILLLAVLGGGAAWGAAPFSHRLHLGMGLECAGCHAQAAASTSPRDNLLPQKAICLGCHESAQIPSPPVSPVSKFSHALHLRLGRETARYIAAAIDRRKYLQPPGDVRRHLNSGNACQACHRGLEESDRVTPAAMPKMADCLVCHTWIEAPFSCEDCHSDVAPLRPATHTATFADTHSSGKLNLDKSTCTLCHGPGFHCAGCH